VIKERKTEVLQKKKKTTRDAKKGKDGTIQDNWTGKQELNSLKTQVKPRSGGKSGRHGRKSEKKKELGVDSASQIFADWRKEKGTGTSAS